MFRSLKNYDGTVHPETISQLEQLARGLRGARVVHINSTRLGGGVSEILFWLVPILNELGIETSWEVIQGDEGYFKATKTFHNGLQGNPVSLPRAMLAQYEATVRHCADGLRGALQAADFVFVHDPQPAPLLGLCPNRKGKWIWRCHIDASHPDRKVWSYISDQVEGYDASIFSMPEFAKPLPHPQFIIAPSIDPLSEKNCELPEAEVKETLQRLGIPADRPIITQVSRYDRFKDPLGVIHAFRLLRETDDARLVLAGGGATDDPEGRAVHQEVIEAAAADPLIHVLLLPPDSHREINALQRASTVILQKSLQEGFGLTVTEALWKSRPVVGGNVGGIRLQVHNHHTGFLVDTPEGAALRLRYLLRHPEEGERMGRVGRRFVLDNFLLTRHLREYLTLMLGLKQDLARAELTA